MTSDYAAPIVEVIGSLHELTLANKYPTGALDGDTYFPGNGQPGIPLHSS